MTYFSDTYPHLRLPLDSGDGRGFREAQVAAIGAISGHCFARDEAAIVVMPTGSGKTAVLVAAAIMLRVRRVLVLTPSKLVREQVADEFREMTTLKRIGALAPDVQGPSVHVIAHRPGRDKDWEQLRDKDVVVATVQSIGVEAAVKPPRDLFDLLLVDEAHHSPAQSWREILELFDHVPRVLFTATPFRRDEREIKGRFVFTYSLTRAFNDHIFGDIQFQAVVPGTERPDLAIAKAAERRLQEDRKTGHDHRVMVRAQTRERAHELAEVYEKNTTLKLQVIHGGHSLRHARTVIERVRSGALDGIIAVNMLGEGFDLPQLKVAALHSPHKSLAVTLQFIGRFARTGAPNLGTATFLAVPSEIEIETERIYEEDRVWSDVIPNLTEARVSTEIEYRDVLDSFRPDQQALDLNNLSLYSIRPYCHVKIYRAANVDVKKAPVFPDGWRIVYHASSPQHHAAIFITREIARSRWSTDGRFADVSFDLFVAYFDKPTSLLFICASRRSDALYTRIATAVAASKPSLLSMANIDCVLQGLVDPEFFNVGMRNRSALGSGESYRILAGPAADKGVQQSDSRLYDRGHLFGRATDDEGKECTIGLSSASKVWSNTSLQIPALLEWCRHLASKIDAGVQSTTGSNVDFLSPGQTIDVLPAGIRVAAWPSEAYIEPPTVRYRGRNRAVEVSLLDFEIVIRSAPAFLSFELRRDNDRLSFTFSPTRINSFQGTSTTAKLARIVTNRSEIGLIDYLNEHPLSFYTDTFGRIEGRSFFPNVLRDPYDLNLIEVPDWAGVDITAEKTTTLAGHVSIFSWLESRLTTGTKSTIICDDGSGEVADYIVIDKNTANTVVQIYHCKGSHGTSPGSRVEDVYEVCGQAIKSGIWARKGTLLRQITHRVTNTGSRFVRGSLVTAQNLLDGPFELSVYVVQPGLSKAGITPAVSNVLAAANDYLFGGGAGNLRVLGSP